MKNLADLKRRLSLGTSVILLYSMHPNHKYLNIVREVSTVQNKSIMFSGGLWLGFPKASDLYFFDEDTFAILDEGKVSLIYTIVHPCNVNGTILLRKVS